MSRMGVGKRDLASIAHCTRPLRHPCQQRTTHVGNRRIAAASGRSTRNYIGEIALAELRWRNCFGEIALANLQGCTGLSRADTRVCGFKSITQVRTDETPKAEYSAENIFCSEAAWDSCVL